MPLKNAYLLLRNIYKPENHYLQYEVDPHKQNFRFVYNSGNVQIQGSKDRPINILNLSIGTEYRKQTKFSFCTNDADNLNRISTRAAFVENHSSAFRDLSEYSDLEGEELDSPMARSLLFEELGFSSPIRGSSIKIDLEQTLINLINNIDSPTPNNPAELLSLSK